MKKQRKQLKMMILSMVTDSLLITPYLYSINYKVFHNNTNKAF